MVTPLLAELIVTGVWIVPNQGGRCRPASALQERKHLTGDEVPQIIDDAWDTASGLSDTTAHSVVSMGALPYVA